MTKTTWLLALLLIVGGTSLHADAAEWRMVFDETVERVTPKGTASQGKQPLKEDEVSRETGTRELRLGDQYVWWISATDSTLYDFRNRRELMFSGASKSYQDYSLFADICFRYYEFQNRQMLQGLLEKAGIKEMHVAGQLPEAESLFSIEIPTTQISDLQKQFTRTVDGGVEKYINGGKTYVTFKPSEQSVPKEYERSWMHALMYPIRMAPEIRKQISATERVPAELSTYLPDTARVTTISLKLKEAGPAKDELGTAPLAGYKLEPFKVFDEIKPTTTTPNIPRTKTDVQAFADSATARGDNVDALLAWFEWGIMTGEQPIEQLKAMRTKIDSDPKVQLLFGGFGGGPPEDQLASLKKLEALPLKKKYLLDVYEGNIYISGLRQPDKGMELLKRAIKANPRLVGAISDLGDCYIEMYETPTGFALYDKALEMSPEHQMLGKVKMIKAKLEHEFPDFF